MSQTAYPLAWPMGWPRTPTPERNRLFKRDVSIHLAIETLNAELRRFDAKEIVISSNVALGSSSPKDKGVCIYFKLRSGPKYDAPLRPYALPCDRWDRVEHNLWALAKHIEALRGQQRWGVGTIDRAFAGYTALHAPGESSAATWYNVLGVPASCTYETALEAYRSEARRCHPDRNGGTHDAMARLNSSWDQARMAFGK